MIANFDRARLALLLLLAVLLGVGMWAYRGVGDSLREIRATGMQTLLNTQVGTLEQWISERLREAEQQAAEPELRADIGDAPESSKTYSAGPRPSPSRRRSSSI